MIKASTATLSLAYLMSLTESSSTEVPRHITEAAAQDKENARPEVARESSTFRFIGDTSQLAPSAQTLHLGALDRSRDTTERERLAGEFRRYGMLNANWDGEGASKPQRSSIAEAVAFVALLPQQGLPESMIHASGHAAMFWKSPGSYAEIEFLGDKRLAYFVERHGDKHKGVVNFDGDSIPAVLESLLDA